MMICELRPDGSLLYNNPGSSMSSSCRLVLLSNDNRHRIAGLFNCDNVPTTAVTLGISNILSAKKAVVMAWGENSSEIVEKTIEEKMNDAVPASYLQMHNHAKVVVDLPAAEKLTRISHPWIVTSCEWSDKVIRQAIVWL